MSSINLWYTLFLVNGLLFLKVMYKRNPKKNRMSISWVSGNWSLIYLYELLDCFWLNNWLWMYHQVFCLRHVGKKCWLFRQVLRALDERHCYHRAKWSPVWSEQQVNICENLTIQQKSGNPSGHDVHRIIQKGLEHLLKGESPRTTFFLLPNKLNFSFQGRQAVQTVPKLCVFGFDIPNGFFPHPSKFPSLIDIYTPD